MNPPDDLDFGQTIRGFAEGQKVFAPDELRNLLAQLGAALAYAHEVERVVHRDIKPANLMRDGRGHLKVTDFGISSTLADSASRMSVQRGSSGSPPYMSPEQMLGEPPKTSDDLYSVGATIYEFLTGKPPFYRGNIFNQAREIVPPPMSVRRTELLGEAAKEIFREWEEALAAALAKNPALRPQSAGELVARLQAPPSPESRSTRRPRVATIMALILVAILVATGTGVWLSRESLFPPPPPTTGSLSVSAPEGATLSLNDGRVLQLPLTGFELPEGDYSGVLTNPGYESVPLSFAVQPGQALSLESPAPSPTLGTLSIEGDAPRGGSPVRYELIPLLLDTQTASSAPAKNVESRTGTIPVTLGDLPTGRYQVNLSTEGWPDIRKNIQIETGSAAVAAWDSPAAALALKVDPPTASVSVDGKVIDLDAGGTIDLPPGTHEIMARREGWPTLTRTVELSANTTTTERFAFPPARVVITILWKTPKARPSRWNTWMGRRFRPCGCRRPTGSSRRRSFWAWSSTSSRLSSMRTNIPRSCTAT